jgi:hypothetical protein
MSLERIDRLWTTRIAQMAKVTSAALLIGLIVWLGGYREAIDVAAQSGTVVWSESIQLSAPQAYAWDPTIATDTAGNVHVMWSQTMSKEDPTLFGGDTLFYARWDGEVWSWPVDVLVSPRGPAAAFPDLAVTPDGTLHAVWNARGASSELMYSHAPACCADHPRNWSPPVSLGMSCLQTTALAADDRGRLHVAFASSETGNIVYRRSDDGGATWPVWIDIVGEMQQDDEFAIYPRLAVDGRGRVHAVWTVDPWPGRLVMYARSDDGGDNWSEPQVIDSVYYGHYAGPGWGPTLIDVETSGEDEVHLIWDGAPTIERNHVWSFDGGRTWSGPDLLFPEITGVGRAGWNDMVVDSAGTLHAFCLKGPLHASWSGSAWSDSTDIALQFEWPGDSVRAALNLGNQLHVVWIDRHGGQPPYQVWYVRGETTAPAVAAQALPIPTPTLLPTPTVSDYLASESATPIRPTRPALDNTLPSGTADPMNAVLWGVIPALVIVSIVLVFSTRQVQRRRRG